MITIMCTIREKHAKYHLDHGCPADILIMDWNTFDKFMEECYCNLSEEARCKILGKRELLGMKIYQITPYVEEVIIIACRRDE